MTDKTKKIIAREGLVISGFVIIALICDAVVYYSEKVGDGSREISKTHSTIFIIFVIYVIVRFIIWAVRTLKTK